MTLQRQLLRLSAVFIALASVFVIIPVITLYRSEILHEKIQDSALILDVIESSEGAMLPPPQAQNLLNQAEVLNIARATPTRRELFLTPMQPLSQVMENIDLEKIRFLEHSLSFFTCLIDNSPGVMRVIGEHDAEGRQIEATIQRQPHCAELRRFGLQLLIVAIGLSLFIGTMLYWLMQSSIVTPIMKLTHSIQSFKGEGGVDERLITPHSQIRELRQAEENLRAMQERILASILQKERLSEIGISVTKIQHDLRNMLSTAQLVADGLETSDDPIVKRSAPRLVRAIDRAITLSTETLEYGRAGQRAAKMKRLNLSKYVTELFEHYEEQAKSARIALINAVEADFIVQADQEYLERILENLIRNALQAMNAPKIENFIKISATKDTEFSHIYIADSGSGIPPELQDQIFIPFKATTKSDGTGLGLPLSKQLAKLMGGDLMLYQSSEKGTEFRISLLNSHFSLASSETTS